MMNPCCNLRKYGRPATLVGILAEHPATSGTKIDHFRSLFLPASLSSAAMPVQHDKSRMKHDISSHPTGLHPLALACPCYVQLNSVCCKWKFDVSLYMSLPFFTRVYWNIICHYKGSLKRLQLHRLYVALLSWCPKTYPVWTCIFSHGNTLAYHTPLFAVRPLHSRPKVALDTSANFGSMWSHNHKKCPNLPLYFNSGRIIVAGIFFMPDRDRLLLWKRMEREAHLTVSERPQWQVWIQWFSHTNQTSIHKHPPSWGQYQSPLVTCSKDCRLSI